MNTETDKVKALRFGSFKIMQVNDIFFDDNGYVFLSTEKQGLLIYNILNKKIEQKLRGRCMKTIKDDDDNYWVSHKHELCILGRDFSVRQVFMYDKKTENGKSFGRVTDIYPDNLNNIWLASGVSGIDIVRKKKTRLAYFCPGNPIDNDNFVRAFYKDSKERLWVGTAGNGIWIFNHSNQLIQHLFSKESGASNRFITAIKSDDKENIWIGTQNGLYKFESAGMTVKERYTKENGLYHNTIVDILDDGVNHIWIATQEGLNKLNTVNGKMSKVSEKDGLIYYKVNTLEKDSLGNIWIGTDKGLSIYFSATGHFTNFGEITHVRTGLSDVMVNALCMDKEGNMWVGTNNGLNKYDYTNRKFTLYLEEDGLMYNIIDKLHLDTRGNFWVHSPIGISRLEPELFTVNLLDEIDRVDFNLNSYLDDEGNLFVGHKKSGFYALHVDSFGDSKFNTPVYITGIGINTSTYTQVPENRELTIGFSNNSLKLKFTTLNYHFTKNIRFAYKLDGFDKKWIFTTSDNREDAYNNLNQGTYKFVVFGSNNNIINNKNGDSLKIIINPPWWRTLQAGVLFIVLLSCMLGFVMYIKNKRNQLINTIKQAKLEKETNDLKLKYFTDISHEIRTPLSLISLPISILLSRDILKEDNRKKLVLANRNITRIQNLVNQLLD